MLKNILQKLLKGMYKEKGEEGMIKRLSEKMPLYSNVLIYGPCELSVRMVLAACDLGKSVQVFAIDGDFKGENESLYAQLAGRPQVTLTKAYFSDLHHILSTVSPLSVFVPVDTVVPGGRSTGPAGHAVVAS